MPSLKTKGAAGKFASLLLVLALSACSRPAPPPETSGELRVGTRNSPATFYIGHDGETAGFEHDLILAFSRAQNWTLSWTEKSRPQALFDMLERREIHLAAAALPQAVVKDRHLISGPILFETPVHVVYRTADRAPRGVAGLAGKKLAFIIGSGHGPMLMRLKRKHPELSWAAVENVWPEELLAQLQAGKYDAVIINGMDFDAMRNFYPGLAVAFDLPYKQKIVWALSPGSSHAFRNALARFVERARSDGTIKRALERYFGHVKRLGSSDILGILQRRPQRLPDLREHFQEAQTLSGIDWRLLAAIGYQESQWNRLATSPTGVRGVMMLTGETADRMGVSDRLNARESILGGARYLALLKDALPARIAEPDRTWLALAAYNQGQGHLEDARRIAQARGGDPNSWADVKEALPYLSRGSYAKVMKYGYARGGEALRFAENIRNYYDILLRLEPEYDPLINLGRGEDGLPPPG
ncbi:extracellular solute-binding protein, family 3 [Thiobacillus denitrificans ATCC 25259]|uniref:Membrane-bound lytic murein transglycosylase F n=1 Tax=Thiobacillus denitrificans (strain ATCC 25259 / T1) TaxID=292415 RepID=MLTF_THIDA|nr:membrane-bound lytic murein transglycosylase MltF [Thiobacillus denitrificans]Q3SJH8.1 RecName: Full=Membrane-bound lytic murein transglycosylase F; AltName: Full=Murein lyase F; Flags: Precursor [Thiobacillus denitrificans ATCC 25259]AAZ97183.1 extracellular solute-binding protein, family 3 [Thiobacillus denitrificans ATCC 25259]